MNYLISYDHSENYDTEDITNAILSISNGCVKLLKSTWIIKHKGKASDIRNCLKPHIGIGVKLVVVKLHREAAWSMSLDHECRIWLEIYF